jgi:hypothetical protein
VNRYVDSFAVITEFLDYLKVRETEETKREQIRARRDVLVLALESEKELILKFFERHFDDRKASLEQLFVLLKSATETNNDKQLDAALSGIVTILQQNPLRDLSEFRKNMANPAFQIEL